MRLLGLTLCTGLALACGPSSSTETSGSGSDSDSASATDTATTTTTTGSTETTGASDTATGSSTSTTTTAGTAVIDDVPSLVCPNNPEFACSKPIDCSDNVVCGGPHGTFDEEGCLRPSCSGSADCSEEEFCHTPDLFGFCTSSGIFCADDPGTGECVCGGDADCGGSLCVPEALIPVPDCVDETDEAACGECNGYVTVQPVGLGPMGCFCGEPQGRCVLQAQAGGTDAETAYYRTDGSEEVAIFPSGYFFTPYGWARCEGADGEPEGCACARMGCP